MSIAKGPATNVHPAKGGAPAAAPARSSSIRQEVSLDAVAGQANRLAQESLSFWLKHGPDTAYGGFHAVRRNFGVPELIQTQGARGADCTATAGPPAPCAGATITA
jgi:hypothetical protein